MTDIVERYNISQQHFWLHGPRSGQPVEFDTSTGMWNVYGYPEAQEILGDPATFSSDTMRVIPKDLLAGMEEFSMAGFLNQIDPPEHGKLRKLGSSAFTRKVVADLEPRIAALTHELLDAARERGRSELVTDLAYPLPVIVIAELLGVPSSDRALFKRWADALFQRDAKISLTEPTENS
jgi:cytochrome P450